MSNLNGEFVCFKFLLESRSVRIDSRKKRLERGKRDWFWSGSLVEVIHPRLLRGSRRAGDVISGWCRASLRGAAACLDVRGRMYAKTFILGFGSESGDHDCPREVSTLILLLAGNILGRTVKVGGASLVCRLSDVCLEGH